MQGSFVQCCFTPTETVGIIRDGEPRTSTTSFTKLLRSDYVHRESETVRTVRDVEPRTSTTSFTQLLRSDYVHRESETVGTVRDVSGAQDVYHFFHTALEI